MPSISQLGVGAIGMERGGREGPVRLSEKANARFFPNPMHDWPPPLDASTSSSTHNHEEEQGRRKKKKKKKHRSKDAEGDGKEKARHNDEEEEEDEGEVEDVVAVGEVEWNPREEQSARVERQMHRLVKEIRTHWRPSKEVISGHSVYTGAAGVALMFLRLHLQHFQPERAKKDSSSKATFLDLAVDYITVAIDIARKRSKKGSKLGISFICGESGVFALAAVVVHYAGREEKSRRYVAEFLAVFEQFMPIGPDFGEWEMLYGCSGYIYGLHYMSKHLGEGIAPDKLRTLLFAALTNGQRPLMYAWHEKEYFAIAHGLSGILHTLLLRPELLDEIPSAYLAEAADTTASDGQTDAPPNLQLIRQTIDWLITTKLPSGNYPTRLGGDNDVLVQWCHGASAVGLLLSRAYEVFGDAKYLKEAESAADVVWTRGLLKKGLGLCHGMSGNAYLFLKLWNATRNKRHLYRAWQFAEFGMSRQAEETWLSPDKPYCLFNGLGGAVVFYSDLLGCGSRREEGTDHRPCFPACDLD